MITVAPVTGMAVNGLLIMYNAVTIYILYLTWFCSCENFVCMYCFFHACYALHPNTVLDYVTLKTTRDQQVHPQCSTSCHVRSDNGIEQSAGHCRLQNTVLDSG